MITEEKPSLEDALVHFGVPGMKWGHRKPAEVAGSRKATPRKPMSPVAKKAAIGAAAVVGAGLLLYTNAPARAYSLGKSAAGSVLRKSGKVSMSVLRSVSNGLGITAVPKQAPKPVKLRGMARVRESMQRGKTFWNPPARSKSAQLQTIARLPVAMLGNLV